MRHYIALVHKDADSAFGTSFPDIPGLFSAADDEADLIANAIEALRLWAEDEALPPPTAIETLLQRADIHSELSSGAVLVRIPLIEDDSRVVRANLTFEAGMLKAIDETAASRGLTRSAFLASCARKEIETTG